MADKQSVQFSSKVGVEAAAAYLGELAQGLRDGAVLVESGNKSLTFDVASEVDLDFEASSKPDKGKSSIEISLSWRAAAYAGAPRPTPALVIGADAKSTPTEGPRPREFEAFDPGTPREGTALQPEARAMKDGREAVQGLSSDDEKKVSPDLGAKATAGAGHAVVASLPRTAKRQEMRINGRRSSSGSLPASKSSPRSELTPHPEVTAMKPGHKAVQGLASDGQKKTSRATGAKATAVAASAVGALLPRTANQRAARSSGRRSSSGPLPASKSSARGARARLSPAPLSPSGGANGVRSARGRVTPR